MPASYAEAFQMLATREVIEPQLASTLAGMAALRDRVAHGYGSIDLDRIWTELPSGLDALSAFAAIVAKRLGPAHYNADN